MRAPATGTWNGGGLAALRATRVDTGANHTPTGVSVSGLSTAPYSYLKISATGISITAGTPCVMTSTGAGNYFAFEVDAEL